MIAFYYILLGALSTALASALHGGDYLSKGWAVFWHMLAAPLVAPIFWIVFRRHTQAKAELDLLEAIIPDYEAVRKAYYIWPLGRIMARVMRYCMENPWPHLGAEPQRIQQELCGGFVIGAFLSATSVAAVLSYA